MLNRDTFPTGPLGVNCSLVWNPESGEGVVVDPGGHTNRIRERIARHGFRLTGILLTHAHFDHIGAARELQDLFDCPVWLHPGDQPLLQILPQQLQAYDMDPFQAPSTLSLAEGPTLLGLETIHTPGHTPGGCCFLGQGAQGPFILVGDTLFAGGVGRTDLWGGDWQALEKSIRTRLYPLADDTLVVPGHGPETTIGDEAVSNPFVVR